MINDLKQYAEIVVNIPVNKRFHYRIPEELKSALEIGNLVKIPFGNRLITGYCVGFTDKSDVENIKDVKYVINSIPCIDNGMLKIAMWISEYYHCSWGEAMEATLPGGVKKGIGGKPIKLVSLAGHGDVIKKEIGLIAKQSPAQARILETLLNRGNEITVKDLLIASNTNSASLSKLEQRRLINVELVQPAVLDVLSLKTPIENGLKPALTKDQQNAVDIIKEKLLSREFGVILLQGVTCSGKTEVYLQAIEIAVSLGLCSIVLVPEIALTPQTIKYFRTRFSKIAVLHSNLTESDRKKQWQKIKEGEVNVVIGTRSAVFAPVKNLGLIVVDEEHENTFKQENTPRYHARDVGIMRALHNKALALLGTATPALESYYNSMIGKYDHVLMNKKIGENPPSSVEIVNMEEEFRETKRYCNISRRLENCMRQAISRNEQIILFLNRRGFAPYINCKKCGFVLKCKSCDITLTYHKKRDVMVCHYCFQEQPPPKSCPECLMPDIKYHGFGTERIEEEIKRRFPEQRLIRMDTDTMRERDAHQNAFSAFQSGEANILLGTQMIAKGLDFPNVTLVGILAADSSLNIPDFRSSERTFQLLAQVSGRTGRGHKGGHVIIQAFNTTHYSIQYALTSDYKGFAKTELEFRKQLSYPPYGRMVRILFLGKKEEKVKEKALALTAKLKQYAKQIDSKVQLLGPAPAPINKIRDKFRWHTILKAPKNRMIIDLLDSVNADLTPFGGIKIIVDVDPGNML